MTKQTSKVSKAVKAAIRSHNFYDVGEALGYDDNATLEQWTSALKSCKTPADRRDLRQGFVSAVMAAGKSEEAAQRRFSRLAKAYSPETSRKAKSNAAKAEAADNADDDADAEVGGDAANVVTLSDKMMARNILRATAMLAAWQSTTADADTLGRIGEILTALNATK